MVKSRKQPVTECTVNPTLTGVPAGPVAKELSSSDGHTAATAATQTNTDARTSTMGVEDAFLGVPETDLLLPDLVISKVPADPTQDIASTEDKQKQ